MTHAAPQFCPLNRCGRHIYTLSRKTTGVLYRNYIMRQYIYFVSPLTVFGPFYGHSLVEILPSASSPLCRRLPYSHLPHNSSIAPNRILPLTSRISLGPREYNIWGKSSVYNFKADGIYGYDRELCVRNSMSVSTNMIHKRNRRVINDSILKWGVITHKYCCQLWRWRCVIIKRAR
jgi:hypothetical protein